MFQGRKIITMLVSLLAAVLLWIYVVTQVTPETKVRVGAIPVSIDGTSALEERSLVIVSQSRESVDLDLNTSRDNLSKLNNSTIRVNADVSKYREPGEYTLNCVVTFPDTVRNVEILRKSEIKVTVERLATQSFDIQLKTTGAVKDGFSFEAASVVLDPAQVVVTGLPEEIEKIHDVVAHYDISTLEETETVPLQIEFLDEDGDEISFSEYAKFSVAQTSATLPVQLIRIIPLTVELIPGGGVAIENAEVSLEPKEIHVKGSAEAMLAFESTLVNGMLVVKSVDLAAISDQLEQMVSLVLPDNVTNQSGVDEVQMKITLNGVSKDKIDVSDIRLINKPEDVEVRITSLTVSVTVRGSTEEIQEIKNNKDNGIYIEVDLADYANQSGALTVTGRVMKGPHTSLSMPETVEIGVILSHSNKPDDQNTE